MQTTKPEKRSLQRGALAPGLPSRGWNSLPGSMSNLPKRYKLGTRAARFLEIRDAVLGQNSSMRRITRGGREMTCGPFLIQLYPPGFCPGRPYNMQIWPAGHEKSGKILHGYKVVNVDWDQQDNLHIFTFRGGPWESELLSLLRQEESLAFI